MPAPRTPAVAADVIIELSDRAGRPIVLIERRNPPHGWAVPGGFVDIGETVEHAARREAREETGLQVRLCLLLGCYSDPRRDPRGHTVSLVYIGEAQGVPQAQDDARSVGIFDIGRFPTELAFDHARVLADYSAYRAHGRLPPLGDNLR